MAKNIGELIVKFYGNPKDTFAKDKVSVVFTSKTADPGVIANLFEMYCVKVLFCLGKSPTASMLKSTLDKILMNGIKKGDNVLHGPNYLLEKVSDKNGYNWICKAIFYENRPPRTKFSRGGENYYAPMCVLAFLQHLIDNLPDKLLNEFSDRLIDF